jgi:hypothetical protein
MLESPLTVLRHIVDNPSEFDRDVVHAAEVSLKDKERDLDDFRIKVRAVFEGRTCEPMLVPTR